MAALYSRRASAQLQILLGLGLVALLVAPAFAMLWARGPERTGVGKPILQPVEFDHRHHVRDDGIDCLYCHDGALRSPLAGLPAASLCMHCHNQIWRDAPALALVRASYDERRPIHWARVNEVGDFVFFDHAAHTRRAVGCASCHGRIDQMARVERAAPLTMAWCLDCHEEPAPHLRPAGRITDMSFEPDPALGWRIARELRISPPTHCSACHR